MHKMKNCNAQTSRSKANLGAYQTALRVRNTEGTEAEFGMGNTYVTTRKTQLYISMGQASVQAYCRKALRYLSYNRIGVLDLELPTSGL